MKNTNQKCGNLSNWKNSLSQKLAEALSSAKKLGIILKKNIKFGTKSQNSYTEAKENLGRLTKY